MGRRAKKQRTHETSFNPNLRKTCCQQRQIKRISHLSRRPPFSPPPGRSITRLHKGRSRKKMPTLVDRFKMPVLVGFLGHGSRLVRALEWQRGEYGFDPPPL